MAQQPSVLGDGVAITPQGGLARRSRALAAGLSRWNSTPEHAVMDPPTRLVLGVCAMDKKAQSKPMREILQRMTSFNEFEVIVFGDKVILEEPVEEWPICDCLLSWHSDGFPLKKAQAYVALRHPFCVNDVQQAELLLDRRQVYKTLKANGIPTPQHIMVNRDGFDGGPVMQQIGVDENGKPMLADPPGFVEDNEHEFVEVNGVKICKPFVEKPVDGEDHNIYIYYDRSHGGGVKRLFRKVDDKSADYDPNHPGTVRRAGSYIYEEFLTTGGTDVKVYSVGPRYAHAEARKSPVVDGRVHRSSDGKEMRYPVLLSPQEKEISRMVTLAFSQKVCGFDLLRSEKGKSYVCDVNGWSFVKNSTKYYDDAAGILRSMILTALAPQRVMTLPMLLPGPIPSVLEDDGLQHAGSIRASLEAGNMKAVDSVNDLGLLPSDDSYRPTEELRCVLAVIRHGDRTPKQKIKIRITQPPLLALFDMYRNTKGDQAKLKSPQQLQELLTVVRSVLASMDDVLSSHHATQQSQSSCDGQTTEQPDGTAPHDHAHAAGHYQHHTAAHHTLQLPPELGTVKDYDALEELRDRLAIVRTVLEQGGGHFSGVNRKVQLKPLKWKPQEQSPGIGKQEATSAPATSTLQPVDTLPYPIVNHTNANNSNNLGSVFPVSSPSLPSSPAPKSAPTSSMLGKTPSTGVKGTGLPASSNLEEALLVVKWGGVLTHSGRKQAEHLGMAFRASMYPRHGPAGGGLLRLHSTYRHDLKIYASDEGRVQVSAAAFAKGLLDLEGTSLTPILVSLVNKDASMLEAFGKGASEEMQACKHVIQALLTHDLSKGPLPSIQDILPCPQPTRLTVSPSPPFSPSPASNTASLTSSLPSSTVKPANRTPQTNATKSLAFESTTTAGNSGTVSSSSSMSTSAANDRNSNVLTMDNWDPAAIAAGIMRGGSPPPVVPISHLDQPSHFPNPHPLSRPADGQPGRVSDSYASQGRSRLSISGKAGDEPTANDRTNGNLTVPHQNGVGNGSSEPDSCHTLQLPDNPLALLKKLKSLMKGLVDQLAAMCKQEPPPGSGPRTYSSQKHAPEEWEVVPGYPCGGERMVLLHDRWRKLYDALYSEKRQAFDISKIPDIYDSVKHDAIHNAHLGLNLQDIYTAAQALADVVIPHEYGLTCDSKLSIGSKIARELVGKLLSDMKIVKVESESTATESEGGPLGVAEELYGGDTMATEFGLNCLEDEMLRNRQGNLSAVISPSPDLQASGRGGGGSLDGDGGDVVSDIPAGSAIAMDDLEDRARHRLCPTYASDINSPLRHVRTRIYFTSESHIHSLINVLRFSHLRPGYTGPALVDSQTAALLNCEMDYLTHIVFRMYEDMAVPVGDPSRFRVEVLFSPGAAFNPLTETPADHTLPIVPLQPLNAGTAGTFAEVHDLLAPFSAARKVNPSTYALSVALKAPSNPMSRNESTNVVPHPQPLLDAAIAAVDTKSDAKDLKVAALQDTLPPILQAQQQVSMSEVSLSSTSFGVAVGLGVIADALGNPPSTS